MKKGGWEEVGGRSTTDLEDMDVDGDETEDKEDKSNHRPTILDDEALASTGMAAALKMANQMGYLEKTTTRQKSTALQELKSQRFSIEDKSREYEEDDRKRRRGDRSSYGGPTTTFAEKKGYKPEVTLEYVDDSGRALSSKEAFRFLSHKFHGKASGKIKTEKRQRKIAEDKVMQKMSSTDTPP